MIREKNVFHSRTRDPKRLLLRRADTERDNLTTAGGLELRHSKLHRAPANHTGRS